MILNQSTCKDDTNSFALNWAKRRELKEYDKIENNYSEFESFIWNKQNESIENSLGFRNSASIFNEVDQTTINPLSSLPITCEINRITFKMIWQRVRQISKTLILDTEFAKIFKNIFFTERLKNSLQDLYF